MKFSKIELEGTQTEIAQFLNGNSNFDVNESQKSTNETTREVPDKPIENKILSVVANIISELKRREFTAQEVSIVANKLGVVGKLKVNDRNGKKHKMQETFS